MRGGRLVPSGFGEHQRSDRRASDFFERGHRPRGSRFIARVGPSPARRQPAHRLLARSVWGAPATMVPPPGGRSFCCARPLTRWSRQETLGPPSLGVPRKWSIREWPHEWKDEQTALTAEDLQCTSELARPLESGRHPPWHRRTAGQASRLRGRHGDEGVHLGLPSRGSTSLRRTWSLHASASCESRARLRWIGCAARRPSEHSTLEAAHGASSPDESRLLSWMRSGSDLRGGGYMVMDKLAPVERALTRHRFLGDAPPWSVSPSFLPREIRSP